MSFFLNPHRHVKIWLSDNRDSFMPPVNWARLMLMRAMNPKDDISLIYDSRLLNVAALGRLKNLCKQYNIRAIDIIELIGQRRLRGYEPELLEVYRDNIENLKQGGNLGVASDILRTLKSVWSQGIYSDLDVVVHTDPLPATIEVEEGLLFNIGSIERSGKTISHFNTNVFAIADAKAAREDINKIQGMMLRMCSKHKDWKALLGNQWPELAQQLPEKVRSGAQALSAREMRVLIDKTMQNNGPLHHRLIRDSVTETTGPALVVKTLLAGLNVSDPDVFMQHVAPRSLGYYEGLGKAFLSENELELFATETDYQTMQINNQYGQTGDLSWTPYGKYLGQEQQALLTRPVNARFADGQGSMSLQYPVLASIARDDSFMPESDTLAKLATHHIAMLHVASESFPSKTWNGRWLELTECRESTPETKTCLTTRARFFAGIELNESTDSPVKPIDYRCESTPSGTSCSGDTSVRLRHLMHPDSVIDAVDEPAISADFAFHALGAAFAQGMVCGCLPDLLADSLYLTGFVSKEHSDPVRLASQLLLAMMLSSWTGLLVMVSASLLLKAAGVKPEIERAAGVGLSLAVGLGSGTACLGVAGMAGSFFGRQIERKIAETAESLLAMSESMSP